MISSMTGFGSGRSEAPNLTISVDVKSVNHRYLDLHVRLPAEFQSLEPVVRKTVTGALGRGRVDVFVKIDVTRARARLEADPELIASYVELARDLQSRFPISGELTMEAISRVPGAIRATVADFGPDEQEQLARRLEEALGEALGQVRRMRIEEGEALVADMDRRIGNIRNRLETLRAGATRIIHHHRDRLISRIAELEPALNVDSNRLEMEILMYAERSDIAEELTRLESHLDQFGGLRSREEEAGKRMDFLLQEMNREVTTILAKTSGMDETGVSIGEAAIDIKVEIDKLREQVQNVE